MISLLARFFRGVHFIMGMSAPPPEFDERKFVLVWLGIVAVLLLFFFGVMYLIPHLLYVRH